MTLPGCAARIAFGADNRLYKRGCFAEGKNLYVFNSQEKWTRLRKFEGDDIAIDRFGNAWTNTWQGELSQLRKKTGKWRTMGLKGANPISAGPLNMYALASPEYNGDKTLYRWKGGNQWTAITGQGAQEISVG